MAINDQSAVKAQYSTAENLTKRMSIHEKYSVNPQGFGNWIVSQYRIEEGMSVLELGCGTGDMWAGQDALIARCARLILSDFSGNQLYLTGIGFLQSLIPDYGKGSPSYGSSHIQFAVRSRIDPHL